MGKRAGKKDPEPINHTEIRFVVLEQLVVRTTSPERFIRELESLCNKFEFMPDNHTLKKEIYTWREYKIKRTKEIEEQDESET